MSRFTGIICHVDEDIHGDSLVRVSSAIGGTCPCTHRALR